jgi:phosphosulfolactate synthase
VINGKARWQLDRSAFAPEGSIEEDVDAAAGAVESIKMDANVKDVADPDRLMWEAPIKSQPLYMIMRFEGNINLGTIQTSEVLAQEEFRHEILGEALMQALLQDRP